MEEAGRGSVGPGSTSDRAVIVSEGAGRTSDRAGRVSNGAGRGTQGAGNASEGAKRALGGSLGRGMVKEKPVAPGHQMVSSSLALLYFFSFCFFF